jgi:hypothetical protein
MTVALKTSGYDLIGNTPHHIDVANRKGIDCVINQVQQLTLESARHEINRVQYHKADAPAHTQVQTRQR